MNIKIAKKVKILRNSSIFFRNKFAEEYYSRAEEYLASAAECGSVKCFRYLLLNNSIPTDIKYRAIEGGNTEIIRILEQHDVSFDDTLATCIRYHRNFLIDWLLENYKQRAVDLSFCIECLNLNAFFFLLYTKIGCRDDAIPKFICRCICSFELLELAIEQYHFSVRHSLEGVLNEESFSYGAI